MGRGTTKPSSVQESKSAVYTAPRNTVDFREAQTNQTGGNKTGIQKYRAEQLQWYSGESHYLPEMQRRGKRRGGTFSGGIALK
uniref:Uncharacterized protein n=1 Tax=Rangifer tarandus platyrhynchus TaxID=3082113 RepID=A0ACB0FB63_RANTA|nr:unnamed protein product [Rangifer tarandus platyrhynchus]